MSSKQKPVVLPRIGSSTGLTQQTPISPSYVGGQLPNRPISQQTNPANHPVGEGSVQTVSTHKRVDKTSSGLSVQQSAAEADADESYKQYQMAVALPFSQPHPPPPRTPAPKSRPLSRVSTFHGDILDDKTTTSPSPSLISGGSDESDNSLSEMKFSDENVEDHKHTLKGIIELLDKASDLVSSSSDYASIFM